MFGVLHMRKLFKKMETSSRCLQGLTRYRQWGNLLTLQAASVDPFLGSIVKHYNLKDLYEKTMGFLKLVAQPSSALHIDCRILEHVAKEIKLIPKDTPAGSSFSSTSGDVVMTGHELMDNEARKRTW
jgi:hypothetical protein